jgi:hypothetical protein
VTALQVKAINAVWAARPFLIAALRPGRIEAPLVAAFNQNRETIMPTYIATTLARSNETPGFHA